MVNLLVNSSGEDVSKNIQNILNLRQNEGEESSYNIRI